MATGTSFFFKLPVAQEQIRSISERPFSFVNNTQFTYIERFIFNFLSFSTVLFTCFASIYNVDSHFEFPYIHKKTKEYLVGLMFKYEHLVYIVDAAGLVELHSTRGRSIKAQRCTQFQTLYLCLHTYTHTLYSRVSQQGLSLSLSEFFDMYLI